MFAIADKSVNTFIARKIKMYMIFLVCAYFEIHMYAEASGRFLSFFIIWTLNTRRGRPVSRGCLLLLGS